GGDGGSGGGGGGGRIRDVHAAGVRGADVQHGDRVGDVGADRDGAAAGALGDADMRLGGDRGRISGRVVGGVDFVAAGNGGGVGDRGWRGLQHRDRDRNCGIRGARRQRITPRTGHRLARDATTPAGTGGRRRRQPGRQRV